MGCGSSTAGRAAAPGEKDPEDHHLDLIEFQHLNIPKYDKFCRNLKKPINRIVGISNDINDVITDVKDTVALVLGAYRVEVETKGIKDHDRVLLTLTKADGTHPTPAEITGLDAKVKTADEALTKARVALVKSLQKTPVGLKLNGDALAPSAEGAATPAEVTAFNTAVAGLRTALGEGYKVNISVVAAAVPGGPGIAANIVKPVFRQPNSKKYDLIPAGLIGIAGSETAKAIYAAETGVAKAAAGVAKALKELPPKDIGLSVKKKSLLVVNPALAAAAEEKKAAKKAARKAAKGKKPDESDEEDDDDEEDEEEEVLEEEEPVEEEEEEEEEESDSGGGAMGESVEARPIAEGDEDEEGGEEGGEEAAEEPAAEEPAAEEAAPVEEPAPAEEAQKEAPAEEKKEEASKAAAKTDGAAADGAKKKGADPNAEKKRELRKAVNALNAEIFKLSKACQNACGNVSVGKGLMVILDAIRAKAQELTGGKGMDEINKLIKIDPKIDMSAKGELDFEPGIKLDLPGQGAMDLNSLLTKLPGGVQLVYASIMRIKKRVAAMAPKFGTIKDEVQTFISSADKVFSNPTKTIQKALLKAGTSGGGAMEIVRMVKAVGINLIQIKDCAKTVLVFFSTVKRITGELKDGMSDLQKALIPAPPAAAKA